MPELVSFILNQFSDTWTFFSVDGFLVLGGKKLADSAYSQLLSFRSQVGSPNKLLYSGQKNMIQEGKNSKALWYTEFFSLGTLKFSG